MTRKLVAFPAVCLVLLAGCATAEKPGLIVELNMSSAMATEAARAALDACRSKGHRVAVAVVDRNGDVKVQLRDDGVNSKALEASRAKAAAAVGAGTDKDAADATGAYPLRAKEQVVGGIGVSGPVPGKIEDSCALAGVNKIKDRL